MFKLAPACYQPNYKAGEQLITDIRQRWALKGDYKTERE